MTLQKIRDWEDNMQESFYDYFMDNHVSYATWALFLITKGYEERAKEILSGTDDDPWTAIPYETETSFDRAVYDKNLELYAELIDLVPELKERFEKFLKDED